MTEHEVRGVAHELREPLGATGPVQPEPHPQVDAALAEVAVRHALELPVAEQGTELAQVPGQPVGRDHAVLETRPGG